MWIDQYLLRKAALSNKMAFVYSLSYNGKVFYIGCAMDLYVRYKQHIKVGKSTTKTSLFIKQILDNNELPELNIIDRLLYDEAILLEANLIKYFSLSGQPLTNHQFKREPLYIPNNIPDIVTPKQMAKIIKYRQEMYIHRRTKSDKFIPFPNEPF